MGIGDLNSKAVQIFCSLLLMFSSAYTQASVTLAPGIRQELNLEEQQALVLLVNLEMALAQSLVKQSMPGFSLEQKPAIEAVLQILGNAEVVVHPPENSLCTNVAGYVVRGRKGVINLCPQGWGMYSLDRAAQTLIHEAVHSGLALYDEVKTEILTQKIGLAAREQGMNDLMLECIAEYCADQRLQKLMAGNDYVATQYKVRDMTSFMERKSILTDTMKKYPRINKIRMR